MCLLSCYLENFQKQVPDSFFRLIPVVDLAGISQSARLIVMLPKRYAKAAQRLIFSNSLACVYPIIDPIQLVVCQDSGQCIFLQEIVPFQTSFF